MIVGVVESGNFEFETYPNPTNGVLDLRLVQSISSPVAVTVLDMAGRTVFTTQQVAGTSQISIHLETLETGAYMVQLSTNEGAIASKMVLKR